ncbi:hypothetical protein LguiB_019186 [Lonicera macranthoides]
MSYGVLSNLTNIFSLGFCGAVRVQKINSSNVKALRGKGRLLSGHSFTSRLDCQFENNRNKLFVAEALSQIHCGQSVVGSICQVFEYPSNTHQREHMAASGSKSVSGDLVVDNLIASCGNVSYFAKPTVVCFNDRSRYSCRKARMTMTNRELNKSSMVHGHFIFDNTQRSSISNPIVGQPLKNYHASSSLFCFDGTLPDVPLNEPLCNEQLASSAISFDKVDSRKIPGNRTLKLFSGSCYLPHPDKEKTGGEDAHFICEDEQAIGVADGVGGWADVGVNAGLYARELMSNSVVAIQNEPKGCIDPARVLDKAHSKTKAKGSSTACIITLMDQGLLAINLGDSGFIVVRDGSTLFQSPVQQHGFNFTYQLQNDPGGDQPSSGQVFTIPVTPGDVIVAGTDGLFDNLFNNEVTAIVVEGVRAGLTPESMAQKVAALARHRALDRKRQSPFSVAAQEAGYRYFGGKLDDITVVVSYISNSTDM